MKTYYCHTKCADAERIYDVGDRVQSAKTNNFLQSHFQDHPLGEPENIPVMGGGIGEEPGFEEAKTLAEISHTNEKREMEHIAARDKDYTPKKK